MRSNPAALREIRETAGHSTWTLAKASKVSQSRISELEAASVVIRPPTAKRLADALGVHITRITISDVQATTEVAS